MLPYVRTMNARDKIISIDNLARWRANVRANNKRLVVTNGCFDLLHLGHVSYLETARNLGDMLLIGMNSDTSVRKLKGKGRPVNTQTDRAAVLAALTSVDAVCIFNETTATEFLELAKPTIYVKGGDYTLDQIPKGDCAVVKRYNGEIKIVPLVPNKSTTSLLKKNHGVIKYRLIGKEKDRGY